MPTDSGEPSFRVELVMVIPLRQEFGSRWLREELLAQGRAAQGFGHFHEQLLRGPPLLLGAGRLPGPTAPPLLGRAGAIRACANQATSWRQSRIGSVSCFGEPPEGEQRARLISCTNQRTRTRAPNRAARADPWRQQRAAAALPDRRCAAMSASLTSLPPAASTSALKASSLVPSGRPASTAEASMSSAHGSIQSRCRSLGVRHDPRRIGQHAPMVAASGVPPGTPEMLEGPAERVIVVGDLLLQCLPSLVEAARGRAGRRT